MAIPNKQIGWSQEANLIWEISRQLEQLIQVASAAGGGPTTTPGIDDVLAQGQSLTADRNIELDSHKFTINDDQGNSVLLSLNEATGVTSLEGSDTVIKGASTLTLDPNNGDLKINNANIVNSASPSSDYLEITINGALYYINLYKP